MSPDRQRLHDRLRDLAAALLALALLAAGSLALGAGRAEPLGDAPRPDPAPAARAAAAGPSTAGVWVLPSGP